MKKTRKRSIPSNILIGMMDNIHNSKNWTSAYKWMQTPKNWFSVAETTETAFIAWRLLGQQPPHLRSEAGWYYWASQQGFQNSQKYWQGPEKEDPGFRKQFFVSFEEAERYKASLKRLKKIIYLSGSVDQRHRFLFGMGHGDVIDFDKRPYFKSYVEAEEA